MPGRIAGDRPGPQIAEPRWTQRVGAYLGVGSSPAALVLGVGIAQGRGGPAALVALLVGASLSAGLLWAQGLLGLAPPLGEGKPLGELTRTYLDRGSRIALNVVLGAAMVGWFGFNVGLGGAALATLMAVPTPVGAVVLGGGTTLVALCGMTRWNKLAVATTILSLGLVATLAFRLAAPTTPVAVAFGPADRFFSDVAALIGYAAVFSVRAPDFTAGLRRPFDLTMCVAGLVVPMVVVTLVGVGVHLGTGTGDIVALLGEARGFGLGNLLIAVAVVAPTFSSIHSGELAWRAVWPISPRAAIAIVSVAGVGLAVTRFDLLLLPWLRSMGAALPPLVVPMVHEAWRRRRGHAPRVLPLRTWLAGSVAGILAHAVGADSAPLIALLVAAAVTLAFGRTPPAAQAVQDPQL
jgi:cytosine permease